MQNALVAGGAGFIGSHLCRALLDRGLAVTCVDSLETGAERNLSGLLEHPHFSFVRHDVREPIRDGSAPDYVFHLASPASVPAYLSRPIETLEVNSVGTKNLLELSRSAGAKFLFASTSEIYGDPLVHPQSESYWGNVNPSGVRACYDEGKRFGEAMTLAYARVHSVDVRIVRIFNTYGPHSRPDDGRIVPNFITQALRDEPITIYGDGEQTRSFCYVSDMVDGLMAAMFHDNSRGETFNIGNPDEYTVLEFARIIARAAGAQPTFVYRPLPADDPARRCPDITKARTTLGWQPKTDLNSGIRTTLEWFRELLAVPQAVS